MTAAGILMPKQQSWAHRSFELSDRSKAMSDPWISERKEKSVERRANCQKKEFADRSKRSLNSKERSAKPHFEQFALERCTVKRVDNPLLETGYMSNMTQKYLVSQRSQDVSWGTTFGTISSSTPLHRNPAPIGCLRSFADMDFCMFFCSVYYTKVSTILRNYIFGNSDL